MMPTLRLHHRCVERKDAVRSPQLLLERGVIPDHVIAGIRAPDDVVLAAFVVPLGAPDDVVLTAFVVPFGGPDDIVAVVAAASRSPHDVVDVPPRGTPD